MSCDSVKFSFEIISAFKDDIKTIEEFYKYLINGPRQANLVLIAYVSSEGSGEPAHARSLARTSAARSYKQWVKRNLQIESQIPGPSEWLGMRGLNRSWRNARRHKFAWRGPNKKSETLFIMTVALILQINVLVKNW